MDMDEVSILCKTDNEGGNRTMCSMKRTIFEKKIWINSDVNGTGLMA